MKARNANGEESEKRFFYVRINKKGDAKKIFKSPVKLLACGSVGRPEENQASAKSGKYCTKPRLLGFDIVIKRNIALSA